MTLALLHINDHCLRVIAENGENRAETGFCYSDDHGLVSGSAAYETAWTKPHLSNNRFWHELNQKPLSRKLKYARHHADMAYAQLCRGSRNSPWNAVIAAMMVPTHRKHHGCDYRKAKHN